MDTFNQKTVNTVRFRVLLHWMRTVLDNNIAYSRKYLWFTSQNLTDYEMRDGNPPADQDRPEYLRGLRLEINAHDAPQYVKEFMRTHGQLDDILGYEVRERNLHDHAISMARMELINNYAEKCAERGEVW